MHCNRAQWRRITNTRYVFDSPCPYLSPNIWFVTFCRFNVVYWAAWLNSFLGIELSALQTFLVDLIHFSTVSGGTWFPQPHTIMAGITNGYRIPAWLSSSLISDSPLVYPCESNMDTLHWLCCVAIVGCNEEFWKAENDKRFVFRTNVWFSGSRGPREWSCEFDHGGRLTSPKTKSPQWSSVTRLRNDKYLGIYG